MKVCEAGNTSSPKMLEMLRRPEGASLDELLTLRRETNKPKAIRLAAVLKVVMGFKNANGYNVRVSGDRYFIKDDNAQQSHDQSPGLNYIPSKEDFETAYRALNSLGDTISIDSVLDQLESIAKKKVLPLKSDWRLVTEKNIEIWSKRR